MYHVVVGKKLDKIGELAKFHQIEAIQTMLHWHYSIATSLQFLLILLLNLFTKILSLSHMYFYCAIYTQTKSSVNCRFIVVAIAFLG